MRVVALIPAYNEEDSIFHTLTALEQIDAIDEIVVIDDGSKDHTLAEVKKYKENTTNKVTILKMKLNRGKGSALNYGLASSVGDIYLLLDADLGQTANLAGELLTPVLGGRVHMTIAQFVQGQSSMQAKMGFGLVRRTAALGVRFLTGKSVLSPLSGQRAVRAELLQTLGRFAPGFGVEVTLTVGALHYGYKVLEVPLAMKHRAYGRGIRGFKHRGRQWLHVVSSLWRCWQRGWHR